MSKMIQESIRNRIVKFFRDTEIERAYLFGSYSRNEEIPGSDLDILVNVNPEIGYLKFVRYQRELSELLGIQVDLLTQDSISPHILPFIQEDLRLIYER